MQTATPPELLVGTATGDDAAVWRLDNERALVSTADFITPVVDDARTWGRVAAANAVSDVYAMGGRPLFALNLVGWNTEALPIEQLQDLLAGANDIAQAGSFVIVGGHTIDDPEPKFGLSVTGEVHPDRIMTNAGLRPGQDIILTKPLGIGVITTAIKADTAPQASVDAAVAREGIIPGGSRRNLAWAKGLLDPGDADELTQLLLADAQTSGGLVFGVDPASTQDVLTELAETGHTAARIGTTNEPAPEGHSIALR